MIMQIQDWNLLRDLIGRKARRILVPVQSGSVSSPVEAVIALDDNKGLLIDSCARRQGPLETPVKYPQLRLRYVSPLPEYPRGETIDLSDSGEIIRRVQILNEEIFTPEDNAAFTKAIHIDFSGNRDITIARNSFREPSLRIFEQEENWQEGVAVSADGRQNCLSL